MQESLGRDCVQVAFSVFGDSRGGIAVVGRSVGDYGGGEMNKNNTGRA